MNSVPLLGTTIPWIVFRSSSIADHAGRLSVDPHPRVPLALHPRPRDAGVGHQAQVLSAAVVDHCQAFLAIKPRELFGVHQHAPAFQQQP